MINHWFVHIPFVIYIRNQYTFRFYQHCISISLLCVAPAKHCNESINVNSIKIFFIVSVILFNFDKAKLKRFYATKKQNKIIYLTIHIYNKLQINNLGSCQIFISDMILNLLIFSGLTFTFLKQCTQITDYQSFRQ